MRPRLIAAVFSYFLIAAAATSCSAQRVADSTPKNPDSGAGSITQARDMTAERASHTATRLADGRVLIAGGFVGEEHSLAGTEIFDPAARSFEKAENMHAARSSHTATLLQNGKVLIAGGFNGEYLDSAELFDPATGKFSLTPKMGTARSGHVAVLLKDGKVLLAGGVGKGWTFLADAEVYDPVKNAFTTVGEMTTPRESHTATLLTDGRVLITGGHKGRRADVTIFSSCEIFDPKDRKFSPAGALATRRHKHDAVLLTDGRVLIAGGSDERDSKGAYRSAEIYDPARGISKATADMNVERYKLQNTSILLKDGKVLIAGGASQPEVFDPETERFSLSKGTMGTIRLFSTATLLANGNVLITGGYDHSMAASGKTWIYEN